MKCVWILLVLTIAISCTQVKEFPDAPYIGITYGTIQTRLLKYGIDINKDYIHALQDHHANVVRIFISDSNRDIHNKLQQCSAFLIPGGFDIHPSRYGETEYKYLENVDKELDALEYKVLAYAREHYMPVLGICRGCQMLNVFYGGSLYQDIPTQFKSDKHVIHRKSLNLYVYTHAMPCYHEIALNTKSRLATICGLQNITVNSYHHQAAKKVAKGFIVNANSLDGSIEGIEYSGNVFIVGTQFHPEMMREENPVFDTVFTVFVNEAHAHKKCKTTKFFGRPDKVGAFSK